MFTVMSGAKYLEAGDWCVRDKLLEQSRSITGDPTESIGREMLIGDVVMPWSFSRFIFGWLFLVLLFVSMAVGRIGRFR